MSGPLSGAVHDLNAARIWGIMRELAASGLVVLADKGYAGAGDHIRTPYKGRNKPASQKAASRARAKLRSPGERANAQLKTWRILRKLRCCPWRAGQLASMGGCGWRFRYIETTVTVPSPTTGATSAGIGLVSDWDAIDLKVQSGGGPGSVRYSITYWDNSKPLALSPRPGDRLTISIYYDRTAKKDSGSSITGRAARAPRGNPSTHIPGPTPG